MLKRIFLTIFVALMLFFMFEGIFRPDVPELNVVGGIATAGTVNGELAIHVDCTFSNSGEAGTLVVWAELTGSETWEELGEVTLGTDEEGVVRFTFQKVTPPDSSPPTYKYVCGHGFKRDCELVALCPTPTPGLFEMSDTSH